MGAVHLRNQTRSFRLCVTLSNKLIESIEEHYTGHPLSVAIRRLIALSWRTRTSIVSIADIEAERRRGYQSIVIRCLPAMAERVIRDAQSLGVMPSVAIETHCWKALQ